MVWDRYDVDGNGWLDREELRAILEDITELKMGHRNVDNAVVQAVFQEVDLNGDGMIQWSEWKAYCSKYGIGFGDVYILKPRKRDPTKRTQWIAGKSG